MKSFGIDYVGVDLLLTGVRVLAGLRLLLIGPSFMKGL